MPPTTNVRSIVPYIGSMNFDGVDDACTVPDAAIPASAFQSGFVLYALMNPRSLGGASLGMILHKATNSGSSGGFRYFLEAVGRVGFSMGAGVTRYSAVGSFNFNVPTFIVVNVSNAGNITHYINGVLSALNPGTSGLPTDVVTTNPLTVGNRSGGTDRTFDGRIAQVGVLSLAGRGDLTQDEVTNLYLHNVIPSGTRVLHLETTANQIKGNQWLDKSGNNNHATIVGPTFSYESPTKRVAQIGAPRQLDGRFDGTVSGGVTVASGAMVFDGVNGKVTVTPIGTPSILNLNDFTYSGWFNFNSINGLRQTIIQSVNNTADRQVVQIHTNGELHVARWNGVSYEGLKSNAILSPLTLYHFAFTRTGSSFQLFLNAVAQSGAGPNPQADSFGCFIGARDTTQYFDGSIPSLQAFNRVLSLEEIQQLYAAGANAPCPIKRGLVAEWSGRDYEGAPATPTRVFSVASWDGMNVQ